MSTMRSIVFVATTLLLARLACAQPSSLNALEQGLQSPAAGGYLGAELDDENGHGVRVKSVKPGTPAEVSGLKVNDLIVDIDGKKITNLLDYDGIAIRPAGAKMVFKVDRGGRQQSLAVTLGTRASSAGVSDQPATETQPGAPSLTAPGSGPSTLPSASTNPGAASPGSQSSAFPSLTPPGGSSATIPIPGGPESLSRGSGITAQPLNTLPPGSESSAIPGAPGVPSTGGSSGSGSASLGITVGSSESPASRARRRGAYIAAVKPGSPAAIAGLPVGGVIVQYDGRSIMSDDDLVNAIRTARPGQDVELTYYDSADRLGKKMVRLGEAGAAPGAASPPAPGGFAAPGGGFNPGTATAQNSGAIPAPSEGPGRPAFGGSNRPLINRIESAARGAGILPPAGPTGPTTVYDPLAMAALQRQVVDLINTVNSMEERIRTLEGKAGVPSPATGGAPSPFGTTPSSSGTPASSGFGSPQTPGFGAPSPSFTPGFSPSNP
jgi:membrane-associated protease RseP (regulator of RpoE activity)